jgi:arylsulfatase A-like enzyme
MSRGRRVTLCAGLAFALAAVGTAARSARPNIVVILADDLGAETLGCYGGAQFLGDEGRRLGPVLTPNIDALARQGMRFERCFATPVCSPSRAELLTGKYNFRSGFTDIFGRNGATRSLDPRAHPTLPARLRAAGYVTAAVGKWHLGPMPGQDVVPASAATDTDYAHPRECGFDRQSLFTGAHLEDYGEPRPGGYTPERMHEWALRFLASRAGKSDPFFLYYASPLPHFPYLPTPLNPDGPGRDESSKIRRMYGDMRNFPFLIEYLDQQVGEIVKQVEELGMRDDTLIVFAGDNGTPPWIVTEMRDGRRVKFGKGTMLDTGSWVPLIARWPGRIAPQSRTGQLVDFTDLMPTLIELAGGEPPPGLDGISFVSRLLGRSGRTREWVHVRYVDKAFVRDAQWKLRETGELFDVRGAPYVESLILPSQDTAASLEARRRLQPVLHSLLPAVRTDPR